MPPVESRDLGSSSCSAFDRATLDPSVCLREGGPPPVEGGGGEGSFFHVYIRIYKPRRSSFPQTKAKEVQREVICDLSPLYQSLGTISCHHISAESTGLKKSVISFNFFVPRFPSPLLLLLPLAFLDWPEAPVLFADC
jgi:hypothetical protein